MAEDRRHSPGEDRISGLPDELLHDILVDLGSVQAAARTSVLSRRWRHVWTRIPKLILFGCDKPPAASFQTLVDAALAAHSAPAVELFRIDIPSDGPRVPACRVAQWIRGVSQRVVGSLLVNVPWPMSRRPRLVVDDEEDLEIPACGGATRIFLKLDQRWRLRLSTAGLFAALNKLTIESARVEGSDLTALVSTQCPRLKSLNLDIVILCTVSDVSMCTDSLEVLYFNVANTRRLDVVALRLEQLNVYQALIEAHISAPNLAKLNWGGGVYDPRRHKFADVGRCLRLLNINETSTGASLLQRFDTVDELKLSILIEQEIFGYHSFFNETKRLPRCETLSVSVLQNHHGLVPVMLHLLRSSTTARELSIVMHNFYAHEMMYPCPLSCPCRLAGNRNTDDITLRSLEEVEISYFTSSQKELEFMEQLSRCSAAVLKKIVIRYKPRHHAPLTKEVCEKVRSKYRSNLKVEFYVSSDRMRWIPFD